MALGTQWHKSSYSASESQCVEVRQGPHRTDLRDSKHPQAARLSCPRGEWHAFISGIKNGEFDR